MKILKHIPLTLALLTACATDTVTTPADSRTDAPSSAKSPVGFGIYTDRSQETRAGAYGDIDTDRLKQSGFGFGVFAYSTGLTPYRDYRTQDATPRRYPNFMYNEHITYDGTQWVYDTEADVKYWPNEAGSDTGENGGMVSFFAYAPYAEQDKSKVLPPDSWGIDEQPVSERDHDGTATGIIAFSVPNWNGGNAQSQAVEDMYRFSDPFVKYRLASDLTKQVDLLWATTTGSSPNIDGGARQLGINAETLPDFNNSNVEIKNQYPPNEDPIIVRPVFNVAADLTKQRTEGTVNLLFKHALAAIGGSYPGPDGSDDDSTTPTNGLMVVLDIDKDGSATGGILPPYIEGPTAATPYNTKVTVNSIEISSDVQLTDEGREVIGNEGTFDYTTHTARLCTSGILNLATGIWSNLESVSYTQGGDVTTTNHMIVVPDGDNSPQTAYRAILADEIAEPQQYDTWAYTRQRFEELPIGVTTVPKNVYKEDTTPLFFIPGTSPVFTITIDYTVRSYDAKLADNYTEVRQKITKRLIITEPVSMNKRYSILMHLGLTSVKFTATVDNWENHASTVIIPGTVESTTPVVIYEEDVEHVYLPANVEGN